MTGKQITIVGYCMIWVIGISWTLRIILGNSYWIHFNIIDLIVLLTMGIIGLGTAPLIYRANQKNVNIGLIVALVLAITIIGIVGSPVL